MGARPTTDSALAVLGWVILRFTWADLDKRPHWVVSTIRRVLPNGIFILER
jgi:very-short-patch-repair endonuclease